MAHKDINEDWAIPVVISIAAGILLYVGMTSAEYRGQPMGNKCIGACYEAVLERRAIALAAEIFISSLIVFALTSRAPLNIYGKPIKLFTWFA